MWLRLLLFNFKSLKQKFKNILKFHHLVKLCLADCGCEPNDCKTMIKNFKCKRCGECCYPPRLYSADIRRIKKADYDEVDFVYIDDLKNTYMKDKKNNKCIFLKKKGKLYECRIYQYRPGVCREYPSELINGSCKPEKLAFDSFLKRK